MKLLVLFQKASDINARKLVEDFSMHDVTLYPLIAQPEWIIIDDSLPGARIKLIAGDDNLRSRIIRYTNYNNFKLRELIMQ